MVDEPKPLTKEELKYLESQGSVAGISSIDARKRVAEVRRLRQLVIDAEPYVPDKRADAHDGSSGEAEGRGGTVADVSGPLFSFPPPDLSPPRPVGLGASQC